MKTQMKFQKRLCLILVILGALTIVYAAAYKTGMLAALGTLCDKSTGRTYHSEAQIFYDTDHFNTQLLWLGIGVLLAACLLYVFANHKKRNYYISNYVVSIIVAALFVAVAVVIVAYNSIYYSRCLDIKADTAFLATWKEEAEDTFEGVYTYNTSCAMFIVGYVLSFFLLAGGVFLTLNMFWKRNLMKGEKELLEKNFTAEVM